VIRGTTTLIAHIGCATGAFKAPIWRPRHNGAQCARWKLCKRCELVVQRFTALRSQGQIARTTLALIS
jgi:hypothetical protein